MITVMKARARTHTHAHTHTHNLSGKKLIKLMYVMIVMVTVYLLVSLYG